ncbi:MULTISPECIES: hypothetical protein [unclassified Methylobacterium]|uniref:hypothetical protein n=1 Tax=unclassified Methylobacterium TaxID=2615210 RepID=UPI0011C20DD2|nr:MULTISPECIES: hypothetical protein [unclassified Methylobacterium]QEE37895.1 hypothetical protein FVA80_01910 [Methylobacterium sp. WL1]TXN59399.1 hypothetical protein FV241_02500 [Methylobacterium sp. WL2]
MAHANPEFALGLMRTERSPVRYQLAPPAGLNALRARMLDIGRRLECEATVSRAEHEAYRLWRRVAHQQRAQDCRARQLADALAEPVGGMHAETKSGERFVEPKRRWPQDVQRGREKVRRGTLPR